MESINCNQTCQNINHTIIIIDSINKKSLKLENKDKNSREWDRTPRIYLFINYLLNITDDAKRGLKFIPKFYHATPHNIYIMSILSYYCLNSNYFIKSLYIINKSNNNHQYMVCKFLNVNLKFLKETKFFWSDSSDH